MPEPRTMASPDAPLPEDILHEAATWLMELHDGPLDADGRMRLAQWRQRSPEHERAWERAALLQQKFQALPAPGIHALRRVAAPKRRAAIKNIVLLLAAGPAAWGAYRLYSAGDAPGRFTTATGQTRQIVLDDGTQVTLNTATDIDVAFTDGLRQVRLRQGEILVSTSRDAHVPVRPFVVETAQGRLRALGTRFTVRQLEGRAQLAVFEGAVEITPTSSAEGKRVIDAGFQAVFSGDGVESVEKGNALALAWTDGMLIADKMPLARFIGELGRYRRGVLQVEERVATLPVSGVFPVGDTTASLTLLEQTMPVRIQFFTRYWARVTPR